MKRGRFPLLRTSLLNMHDFPLFPGGGGRKQAFSRILNFSNFLEKPKKQRKF